MKAPENLYLLRFTLPFECAHASFKNPDIWKRLEPAAAFEASRPGFDCRRVGRSSYIGILAVGGPPYDGFFTGTLKYI